MFEKYDDRILDVVCDVSACVFWLYITSFDSKWRWQRTHLWIAPKQHTSGGRKSAGDTWYSLAYLRTPLFDRSLRSFVFLV